jgi:hypothetical protein
MANVSGQTALLTVKVSHADGTPWAKGIVKARLNRSCKLYSDVAQSLPVHVISSAEEIALILDSNGEGVLTTFQQALLKPLDGTAKTSLAPVTLPNSAVAYNPYYLVTLPDASIVRVVPVTNNTPNQSITRDLDDYIWAPSVYVPY